MGAYTPPPSQAPTRKHSLHYILSPASLVETAPDVPGVRSPIQVPSSPQFTGKARRRPTLLSLPSDILGRIAYHVIVGTEGFVGRPSMLLPLLQTSRALNDAIKFDNNPVLYNRLFRATFDVGALIRRTQWMFDVKTDVPGTSRKTELFGNPRSWAIEYKNRWELRRRMRACIAHQSLNVPGMSSRDDLDNDMWALWFLWTENDSKNLTFLTDECWFHEWIICYYKDDMLKDSLKAGYPKDTAEKALGIWTAILSGSDLFAERNAQEIDDKIYLLRPYVFAPHYELTYAKWEHKKLPLCKPECTDHAPIAGYAAPYKRFGHNHMRAPPHFVLGAMIVFIRLVERQPTRIGLKQGSTVFQGDIGRGLFSLTHIMPSLYHDQEWQRNTVCQDPHTSPGLPPLSFHGRLQGFWRGVLLFFDFDGYRQMLAGNMRAAYTGTFAQHAVELELKETVIRVPEDEVGGKGTLLNCGFAHEETEEEQTRIQKGYGYEVLTGQAIHANERPGWTKEILLTGGLRSAWGWSRVRGRVRAWDGLVTLAIGAASPYPCGKWVWRGYIHTGGYWIGRWRDCFAGENQRGYEGPLGLIRAGDLFYAPHFPTSMKTSPGVSKIELGPNGAGGGIPGMAPGGVDRYRNVHTPSSVHSVTPTAPSAPSIYPSSHSQSGQSSRSAYSRGGSAHGSHGSRGSRGPSPRSPEDYQPELPRPHSAPKRKISEEEEYPDYYRDLRGLDQHESERRDQRDSREARQYHEHSQRERSYHEHEMQARERERELREHNHRELRERDQREPTDARKRSHHSYGRELRDRDLDLRKAHERSQDYDHRGASHLRYHSRGGSTQGRNTSDYPEYSDYRDVRDMSDRRVRDHHDHRDNRERDHLERSHPNHGERGAEGWDAYSRSHR